MEKNKKEKDMGYPPYPPEEDIIQNAERVELDDEKSVSPHLSDKKLNKDAKLPEERLTENAREQDVINRIYNNPADDEWSEENFDEDYTGEDLDVPGSEDDDEMEDIGSEDEENNYYSLGGERKKDI